LHNSESWWFEVGAGDLMLFPSSLTHMVETVQGDERVSLAFNTFPVGYVGEEESLTALHLEQGVSQYGRHKN
jgi:predicted 2-oxoglutarate/Fe(II)-dependent dioxygenase YbiX